MRQKKGRFFDAFLKGDNCMKNKKFLKKIHQSIQSDGITQLLEKKKKFMFPLWKQKDNDSNNIVESGRSMVEMLGVLAVIGVLSVSGIVGYNYAMNKYQANQILNELNLVTVQNQIALARPHSTNYELSLGDPYDGGQLSSGYAFDFGCGTGSDGDTSCQVDDVIWFEEVSNIPQSVCKILVKDTALLPYLAQQFLNNEEDVSGENCTENNTILMVFETEEGDYEHSQTDPECTTACGESCCRADAVCVNDSICCLSSMACGDVCCPSDKPLCKEGVCTATEKKSCTTNADCGEGYFCRVGANPICSGGTVRNKCEKLSVRSYSGNGVQFARSKQGDYTRWDLDNFCEALGMNPLTETQIDCAVDNNCYAKGLYENFGDTSHWTSFWIISNQENTCAGDIAFYSTRRSRNKTLGGYVIKNERLADLVCAKGTPTGSSCDSGFKEENGECICKDDNACYKKNPIYPFCIDGKCSGCHTDEDCATTPDTPYCNVENQCVACTEDSHCNRTPATPICGDLYTCTKCSSDDDCASVSGKPYCNAIGHCVECYNNDHCPDGKVCQDAGAIIPEGYSDCIQEAGEGTCKAIGYTIYTDTHGGKWYKATSPEYGWGSWNRTYYFCDALRRKLNNNHIRMLTRADLGCPNTFPSDRCLGEGSLFLQTLGYINSSQGIVFLEEISNCTNFEWVYGWGDPLYLRPASKNSQHDLGLASYVVCYEPPH